MKKIFFICLLALTACKSKDPGLTSPEGKWGYTTPDQKIVVTFEVIKASSGFDIQNQTMKVNAVSVNAEKEVIGFTATSIQEIRINANDSKVTYPYNIVFNNATVSSDFKKITVPTATYTYPWGTTVSLSDIVIGRQ